MYEWFQFQRGMWNNNDNKMINDMSVSPAIFINLKNESMLF